MKTKPAIKDLQNQRIEHSREMVRLENEIGKLRKKELAKYVGTVVRVHNVGVCKITEICEKSGWLRGYYFCGNTIMFHPYLVCNPSDIKPRSPKLWEKQIRKAIAHLEKLI